MNLDKGIVRRSSLRRSLVKQTSLVAREFTYGAVVANVAPVAGFSSVSTLLSVAFTDTSTDSDGTITAWDWDWGDGTTHGTTQNPVHVYSTSGTYSVTLTVTDNSGATNAVSHNAVVLSRATVGTTHMTTAGSTTDGPSIPTISKTPTANALQLLAVVSHNASGLHGPPVVTGCGLTWVAVDNTAYNTVRRITLFRALGASPTTGTLTISWGADTQTAFAWSWLELTGVDTSGTNGSGAIVQSNKASSTSGATCTVTLAAFENAKNVHACFVSTGNNNPTANDANFVEQGEATVTSSSCSMESQTATNVVSCVSTFTATSFAAISVEVKAGVL